MNLRIIAWIITLCILVGCSKTPEGNQEKAMALEARGKYLALNQGVATVKLVADYGQRVYEFAFVMVLEGDNCTLTLTAPEELAGIAVTQQGTGAESKLLWEDVLLETGTLGEEGLTPITAIPALLQALKSGYVDSVTLKNRPLESGEPVLEVFCRDPQQPYGQGIEYVLWVGQENYPLLGGEIYQDGVRIISCQVQDFVMS